MAEDVLEVRAVRGLKLKLFAALVLRAMAREQTERGTEQMSPRDPGVALRLGLEPDAPELAAAERYLVHEWYIERLSAEHTRGSFTITEWGWAELGYQHSPEGWRRRPWWKRMLGV